MLKFLKRAVGVAPKPAAPPPRKPAAAGRSGTQSRQPMLDPLPVPDVQEVDDESAWDMWENSQMELDSRMGPLSVFDSVKVKDASPSRAADLEPDPFASVRRKR
ncbi:MAG: hypothetical protein ACXWC6_18240 [Ramlibacter sp.]